MKIKLTKGKFTLVDDELGEYINQFSWYYSSSGYAARRMRQNESKPGKMILLHRFILGLENSSQVDHINRDRLDNRKINLRFATQTEQNFNSKKRKNSTSKYKGVHWQKDIKRWRSVITINNKKVNLGTFLDENLAAEAYNKAASKYYKDFVNLNKVIKQ